MFPVSKSVQSSTSQHAGGEEVSLITLLLLWHRPRNKYLNHGPSSLRSPYRIPRKNWRTDRYSAAPAVNWTGLVVVPCSAVSHGHSKHSFMRLTSITTWTLISKSSDFGIIYGPSTVITRPVIVPRFPTTPPREHFLPVLWLYKKYTQKFQFTF